jgi:hypothetical protein
MVADGMLTRKRYREVPPRVDYELTERARDLMPVLAALAKWGYEWAWSAPRSSESVDLGAILRLTPGLVNPDGSRGEIELNVTDGGREGGAATYTVTMSGDRTEIAERAAENADATITADTAAWVRAFAPGNDRRGLKMTGNDGLAGKLIDLLALSSTQPMAATEAERAESARTAAA